MKTIGISFIAGLMIASLSAVGCGGPPASGGAGTEPASLLPGDVPPPGYVPTANGYMHASCVIRLQTGEEVAAESAAGVTVRTAAGASRQIPRCNFPRYRNPASFSAEKALPQSAPAAARPPAAAADGVTVQTSELHATYGEVDAPSKAMRSTWTVPESVPNEATQISLWPGLQNARPTDWVLQPILEAFLGPPWTIAPCYYSSVSNVFMCQPSVTVNGNDTIQGTVTGSNCNSSTQICSTWTVQVTDLTTGQSPQALVINGINKAAFRIITADLELYSITSCSQLPGGALPNFATEWQSFDGVWRSAAADVFQGAASPWCLYDSWVAPKGSIWSMYLGWWTGYAPYPVFFDSGSDQRYTGLGDWAYGYYKSECGSSDWVVGLSALPSTGRAHSALCGYDGNINSKLLNRSWSTVVDFSAGDSRRATNTGDWDPGYRKGECAADEAVTGIAQTTGDALSKILCTRSYQEAVNGTCYARVFSNGDNRGNTAGDGDWAAGYYKGQCDSPASAIAVKGVSRDASGKAHAILCCPYASNVGD